MSYKICTFCNSSLPATQQFFKRAPSHDGLSWNCWRCPPERRCIEEGCKKKKPVYAVSKHSLQRYCREHGSKLGYKNIVSKRCEIGGCSRQPIFGYNKPPTRCKTHKENGMIDCVNPLCSESECGKRATYNYPNKTRGKYCKAHRIPAMIDVMNPSCFVEGCRLRPHFNHEGETVGIYCSYHCTAEMVNVMAEKCLHNSCNKIPNFNFPGETVGKWCKAHSTMDMIDVGNRKCMGKDCRIQPRYGLPGLPLTHCATHKESGMTKGRRTCIGENCFNPAIFGSDKPLRCEICCYPTDKNLIESACSSCGLIDIVNQAGLCHYCDPCISYHRRLSKQRLI